MIDKIRKGHREKLRESFIKGDEIAHTDVVLLELLLTYAIPRRDIPPLAKELIEEFGSLSDVLAADLKMLCKIKGIQSYSATLIKLSDWIRSHCATKKAEQTSTVIPDTKQTSLFDIPIHTLKQPPVEKGEKATPRNKVVRRREIQLFSNAVLKETIALLPNLPETDSLDKVRGFFTKSLPQSAEQTRQRYANYIVLRMFPNGNIDGAMRIFARHFRGRRDLQEVCFYRFLRAEPLLQLVVEEVILPSVGNGRVKREKIRDYLANRFQASRNVKKSAQAIADAIKTGGIAKVDRKKITFGYREIPIPAFAFVLHSEFPDPGMYDIAKLEGNKSIKAMLWNPDRVLPSLYELRNRGLISKISEIDSVRQFTVKWNLDQLVENLIDARKLK